MQFENDCAVWILDLQTCKIIDIVIEITMTTPWLCYHLSFNNQIWCRDSFQEGIGVCPILLFCISSNIVSQRWGGGNQLFFRHRRPKVQLTLVELKFKIICNALDVEVRCPGGSCCPVCSQAPTYRLTLLTSSKKQSPDRNSWNVSVTSWQSAFAPWTADINLKMLTALITGREGCEKRRVWD